MIADGNVAGRLDCQPSELVRPFSARDGHGDRAGYDVSIHRSSTMAEFVRPTIEEVSQFVSVGQLRADSEQQQQQQQQQQGTKQVRRFLNLETMNPEEEIVTKLTTEIKTINRLAARGK
jgi:hypothetical protein